MDVYKIYAQNAATADAVASLDIRQDGHIVALSLATTAQGCDALNDGFTSELSFASTRGTGANDTTASIATCNAHQGFLTSGGSAVQDRMVLSGLAIPVKAGERMYVHHVLSGGATSIDTRAYMYVMPLAGGDSRPEVRRR